LKQKQQENAARFMGGSISEVLNASFDLPHLSKAPKLLQIQLS
jgi:hypothetical protein